MSQKVPSIGGWFLTMVLLSGAAIGLFSENLFWGRVSMGVCWVFIVMGILGSLAQIGAEESKKKMRRVLALTPRWRSITAQLIDIPVLIALAGFGHWVTFGFFVVQAVASAAVQQLAYRESEESDENENHRVR